MYRFSKSQIFVWNEVRIAFFVLMMMILFLLLTWYMLWKKNVKNDAHDTKNDKSLTYMA